MYVIFNADDFGRTPSINAAVIEANRQGILTSTSLMVAEDAVSEAVALARETPDLAIGLHLVVIAGKSVLKQKDIPHLVNSSGHFSNDAVSAGLSYFFSRTVRQELALEMEAQFECFMTNKLPLSHVDGHAHMHMHPSVFSLLVPLAERYGAVGIRIPRDDLRLSLAYDRKNLLIKTIWSLIFGLLSRWSLSQLNGNQLMVTDRVYGLMQTGQMQEGYVISLLRNLSVATAEIYFHPDTVATRGHLGPNPGDLATLLSKEVREVIQERSIQPTTYAKLPKKA